MKENKKASHFKNFLNISLILLVLSFGCLSAYSFEVTNLKWRAPEYRGLSFMYSSCLEATNTPNLDGLVYSFANTDNCPKSEFGKWRVQIGFFNEGKARLGKKALESIDSKIKVNGISVELSELKDSSNSYTWKARFTCNKTVANLLFYRDMNLPPHDWKHKIPPMFKEFLETVRCEEI